MKDHKSRIGADADIPASSRTTRMARLAWLLAAFVLGVLVVSTLGQAEELDLRASRVYIFVGKTGLGHEHAVAGKLKSGQLRLGAKEDAGELVFDMTSFTADTAEARKFVGLTGTTDEKTQKEVNTNMLGPDVLDVKKYPTAKFMVDSATPTRDKPRAGGVVYRLSGEFTLHGVKQPLEIRAEAISRDDGTQLRGSFPIRQTAFGIKPFSKAFGAIGVADELTVSGELVFAGPQAATRRTSERR